MTRSIHIAKWLRKSPLNYSVIRVDTTQLFQCMVISSAQSATCQPNVAKVLRLMSKPKRIGIFSGSFDPVHKGHIAFALSSLEQAKLDAVYFAPETKPRRKPHVSHISHRVTMLDLATRSLHRLHVLDLTARYFTPKSTVSKLQHMFPGATLVLLMGSDMLEHLHTWKHVDYMLSHVELAVGVRSDSDAERVGSLLSELPVQPKAITIIHTDLSETSSSKARSALRGGGSSSEVTASVQAYAKKNWLYHDLTSL